MSTFVPVFFPEFTSSSISMLTIRNTHLDLVRIPQSGGKMSKRLGGIYRLQRQTSLWHLNVYIMQ